jgi:CheY-like chemotaxis protein
MARQDHVPCFKIGKDWRFRREALVQWADSQRPGPGGLSVLIVDDDHRVCRALGRMVEKLGHRARKTTNGHVALEEVAVEPPDLVLLDLAMPGLDGAQLLGRLRQSNPELPVAVVTGHSKGALMRQAMAFAPVMLLPKPVDPDQLRRTLNLVQGKERSVG